MFIIEIWNFNIFKSLVSLYSAFRQTGLERVCNGLYFAIFTALVSLITVTFT